MKIHYKSYLNFILDIYAVRNVFDLGEILNNLQGILIQFNLEDKNKLMIMTDMESIYQKSQCSLPAKVISRYGPRQMRF